MAMACFGDLPVLFLEGSPERRGLVHGRAFGQRIHRYVRRVQEIYSEQGIAWGEALAKAESYLPVLQDKEPEALQELAGIARGADLPVNAIVAINAPHELRLAGGCTTIVALPSATQSGHTLVGKNYDEPYQRLKTDALFVVAPEKRPRFVTLASVGTLSRDGFNERGTVLLGNGLSGPKDGQAQGIPFPILRRHLLVQPGVMEVGETLAALPRSHACNYTVASSHGEARAFEASVDTVYSVAPESGLLVHTNHFIAPDAVTLGDGRMSGSEHSRFRLGRVKALLQPKVGRLTLEDIHRTLADHGGYPGSICSHGQGGGSLASYWMDLEEQVFCVKNGPPCETPVTEIPLRDLGISMS